MHLTTRITIRWIILMTVLLLGIPAGCALAGAADLVEIGGTALTASDPYWKTGGGATADDWDAYFDTGTVTPTLRLKNVTVNTININEEMLYANGDIVLELLGTNTLSLTGDYFAPAGIAVEGDITITDGTADGTGHLYIDVRNDLMFAAFNDGVYSDGDIVIQGGQIHIGVESHTISYGVYAYDNLYIHGGEIYVESEGIAAGAVGAVAFRMSGGLLEVHTRGEFWDCYALNFEDLLVTGGNGKFISDGNGFGGIWDVLPGSQFRVLNGQFIFSGKDEALYFPGTDTYTPHVTDRIYVSTDRSGAGKLVWNPAMGVLAATDAAHSAYRYVELIGSGMDIPQAGDTSRPWLWLILGCAALLGAGAIMLWHRKRKS